MKSLMGKLLFWFSRFILGKLGFNISLSSQNPYYPELETQEIDFVKKVYAKSLTMTSFESLTTLAIICKHFSHSKKIGCFVEVGVWRGGSSLVGKKFLGQSREYLLFDTYAGMTEPTEHDFRAGSKDYSSTIEKWQSEKRGEINNWVFASLEEVKQNFRDFQLLDSKVKFIKGDVKETLNGESIPERILVLRLDTDFYESTLLELKVLWPKVVSGGVLILDDYGHWEGARRAVDEYFLSIGENNLLKIPIAGGGGRIVIKD